MLKNVRLRAAIAVSLRAIAGAFGRYYVGLVLTSMLGVHFPRGTFGVNLSGGLLMGLITAFIACRGYGNPAVLGSSRPAFEAPTLPFRQMNLIPQR